MDPIDDLELAVDDTDELEKKPSKLKKILFVALPVSLISVAVGTYFMIGDTTPSLDAKEVVALKNNERETKGKAIYVAVDPEFMINLNNEQGVSRYLRVQVTLLTRKSELATLLNEHMPLIKNDLLALFSSQSYEGLKSLEGKRKLRKDALQTVQEVLKSQNEKNSIESVLFTNFIME